jgi:hypothetical protein
VEAAGSVSFAQGGNFVMQNCVSTNSAGAIWVGQTYSNNVRPVNITIRNNYWRTVNTDAGNNQRDIFDTEGVDGLILEGNYLELRWGGAGNNAHDDIFQTWQSGSSGAQPPINITLRYNTFVMNCPGWDSDRSWTMIEMIGASTNYIHNNLFLGIAGAGAANGLNINNCAAGAIFYIYNNTFVAKSGASENTVSLNNSSQFYFRNNIVYAPVVGTMLGGSGSVTRDHNLWIGANRPGADTGGLSSAVGGGADPLFADYANNDFSVGATSPARNAGSNLGSTYANWMARATRMTANPTVVARHPSNPWTMGAFGSNLAAPTGVTAS